MAEKKEYNYGLALLKVFSMIGIVILHILNNGGVYSTAKDPSVLHGTCRFIILPLASCSVNCFAITSGYLAVHTLNRPFSIKRWAELWLEVVFYSVIMMLAAHFIINTPLNFVKSFFPVTNNVYWYFTAYTGLMMFLPIINGYAVNASERALKKVLIVLLGYHLVTAVFCYWNSSVLYNDIFKVSRGYSAMWLIMLYIYGLVIGKTGAFLKIKTWLLVIGVLAGVVLCGVNDEFMYNYPPLVLTSLSLFLLFERMKIKKVKIIKLFSIHSFAVYILNTQPDWFKWYQDKFVFLTKRTPIFSIGFILIYAVLFFVIAVLIDMLRACLFKLLRTNKLCEKADELVHKVFERAVS